MSTITFDTHKVINDLEKAGMPKPQAEALIAALKEAQAGSIVDLVTKLDLQKELEPIRSDIRMLKWMVSVNLAGTLALIGLMTTLITKLVK